MAKQLTPTARPAAGPQRVRADGECVLLPVAAVVAFMEFLALELNNNLVSHHNNACLFCVCAHKPSVHKSEKNWKHVPAYLATVFSNDRVAVWPHIFADNTPQVILCLSNDTFIQAVITQVSRLFPKDKPQAMKVLVNILPTRTQVSLLMALAMIGKPQNQSFLSQQ